MVHVSQAYIVLFLLTTEKPVYSYNYYYYYFIIIIFMNDKRLKAAVGQVR